MLFFASWLICLLKEYKKVLVKKFFKKNKVAIAIGISGAKGAGNENIPLANLPLNDEIAQGENLDDLGIKSFNSNDGILADDSRKTQDLNFPPVSKNKIVPL